MDCSPPDFSLHGISQQEYQSGLPFPSLGDLPSPRIEPGSPASQADSLLSKPLVESLFNQEWCISSGCWVTRGISLTANSRIILGLFWFGFDVLFFFFSMKRHKILHVYFPMVQHIWAEFCMDEESNIGRYYYVQKRKKKTVLLQNSVRTSGFVVSMSFGNNAVDYCLSL